MIEDNIRVLRQAAAGSSVGDKPSIERRWCVIAGNVDLIDEMAYKAIASANAVKILFREHVILKDGKLDKKFDFLMLRGNYANILGFESDVKMQGGAFVQVSRRFLAENSNLMVFVAPDDVIKDTVTTLEKSKVHLVILDESQTTGFIDVDINNSVKLPNFVKSALKPFYNANEVVLSTIVISVERDEDISKVQSIATSNRIFVIDFKDIVTED
jgi:hypothetical protein